MKKTILLITILLICYSAKSQSFLSKAEHLIMDVTESSKKRVFNSLDTLFYQIENTSIDSALVNRELFELNYSSFSSLKDMCKNEKQTRFFKKQLINLYPVSSDNYLITIAYIGIDTNKTVVLKSIVNLIAKEENGKIVFSIPLKYHTKTWKVKKIGNITYHYKDILNKKRAQEFNRKNTMIAEKLNMKAEKFEFYMSENYQEFLALIGHQYELNFNGKTRAGYGVDAKTIFAIMGNEDFSHDIIHYYSQKIHTKEKRNWIAEEGLAYYWGNAYYTDKSGEMIKLSILKDELRKYIIGSDSINLLNLFERDIKIFDYLAAEISVRSVISGLLCKEVEKRKGVNGIKALISCGKGFDKYLEKLDSLIGINKINFSKEVSKIILS